MTEEATGRNTWAPEMPTLRSISRAAFELDDYTRIVEILHKRFRVFALLLVFSFSFLLFQFGCGRMIMGLFIFKNRASDF